MRRRLIHIITTALLGIVLVALTVANASAQIVVNECDTMTFGVNSRPNIDDTHFIWDIFRERSQPTDVLNETLALDRVTTFVDGMYAGKIVSVTGLEPGKYYVSIHVWDEITCTDNVEMYTMEVIESTLEMELYADSVCIGEPTNVYIRFTGVGPYEITYTVGDELTPSVVNLNGTEVDPEITIPIMEPLPVGETTFWVIKVEDNCKAYEFTGDERPSTGIVIYPKPAQQPIYLKDGD